MQLGLVQWIRGDVIVTVQPSRMDSGRAPRTGETKFLLLIPRAATRWFCKNELSAVLFFACFSKTENAFLCNPVAESFLPTVSQRCAVYRALESGLWPPRPIGQRPSREWPGWDQSPWPRSVWSGLSRFLNVLIPTRAALPNRPL